MAEAKKTSQTTRKKTAASGSKPKTSPAKKSAATKGPGAKLAANTKKKMIAKSSKSKTTAAKPVAKKAPAKTSKTKKISTKVSKPSTRKSTTSKPRTRTTSTKKAAAKPRKKTVSKATPKVAAKVARPKPLLSIAIPSYNRPSELKLALETFAQQIEGKFEDVVEIIVTDDRSTDDTPDVVTELSKKYNFITLKRNRQNIGLEKNLINCAKNCSGDYLWIFGDDDYLEFEDSLEEILGYLRKGEHEFFILNRKRRSKDLSVLISDNWMRIPEDKNVDYKRLTDFCLEKGLISVIGFISVNIFKRDKFLNVSPDKYFGTMYPQLGMMLEAFHNSATLLVGRTHICHRTATMEEKKAALGDKASESKFMSDERERNSLYFSIPFIRLMSELKAKGAFTEDEIVKIPENTVINGYLIDFLIDTACLANEVKSEFTGRQWQETRAFFDSLYLTSEQKRKLRQVWSDITETNKNIRSELTFSVITPSFNQGEFLQECLDMAQGQTLKPMEHFVFDPGSTDNSRDIAAKTPGVTLVAEPDEGQSDAINKGFLRAKGDIIAWVNSDDCYVDDLVFERIAERFDEPDAPDIVYGNGIFEDEEGRFLRDSYINKDPSSLHWRFQHEDGILQPALFMRRSVVEKIGLLTPHRHYCMDYEYWIRCMKAGLKFVHIDQNFARARYHSSNKTFGDRDKSYIDVCDMMMDQFGYVNHIWLRRYAEYLAAGYDGVLKNADNQDENNDAEIDAHYDRLLRAYNTNADTYEMLEAKCAQKGFGDTLRVLRERGIEKCAPCKTIPLDQAWEEGHASYTVAHRRWAFDKVWKDAQIAKSHKKLREDKANRRSDTCIIVGNGPSLNKIDMSLFKGHDVIVSNNVHLSPELLSYAKYYTVVNYLVAEQSCQHINQIEGLTKVLPYWLAYCLNEGPETFFMDAVGHAAFSKDMFKNMSWRHTVTFYNMHLAYGLGYKRVILTGFDHSYKQKSGVKEGEMILSNEKDDNHFNGKYFQGKKWQAADVDMMEEMYKLAKVAYEEDGREIINATVGGHLELFKRQELSEALSKTKYYETGNSVTNSNYVSQTFTRDEGAGLDETDLVFEILKTLPKKGTMIDVGAHHGSALAPFQTLNWDIYAYEPDPKNRIHLVNKFSDKPNVKIDVRAVGEAPQKDVVFYSSDESAGISGMLKFRDSHKQSTTVDVTTVGHILDEENIEHVEFLKIDVEGYDYSVLKGVPWNRLQPDVIESEFEDAKTLHLGHTWREICQYLDDRGYTVYVSEWHPIVRYGIQHQWHALKKFPCELSDSNAWGNLLAFKKDPGPEKINAALNAVLKVKNPKVSAKTAVVPPVVKPAPEAPVVPKPQPVVTPEPVTPIPAAQKPVAVPTSVTPAASVTPALDSSNVVTSATVSEATPEAAPVAEAEESAETQDAKKPVPESKASINPSVANNVALNNAVPSRPAYAGMSDKLRRRSPALFRVAQLGMWALRFVKRHALLAILAFISISFCVLGPFYISALVPFRFLFWGLAVIIALGGIGVFAIAVSNTILNRIAQREQNAREAVRKEIMMSLRASEETARREASKAEQSLSDLTAKLEQETASRNNLRNELATVQSGLKNELQVTSSNLKNEIVSTRSTLKNELAATQSSLKNDISAVSATQEKRVSEATSNLDANFSDKLAELDRKFWHQGTGMAKLSTVDYFTRELRAEINKQVGSLRENLSEISSKVESTEDLEALSHKLSSHLETGLSRLQAEMDAKAAGLAKTSELESLSEQIRHELVEKLSNFDAKAEELVSASELESLSEQIRRELMENLSNFDAKAKELVNASELASLSDKLRQEFKGEVSELQASVSDKISDIEFLQIRLNELQGLIDDYSKEIDVKYSSLEEKTLKKTHQAVGKVESAETVFSTKLEEMMSLLNETQKRIDEEAARNTEAMKSDWNFVHEDVSKKVQEADELIRKVQKLSEEKSRQNSTSFMIAHEQLEMKLLEKLKATEVILDQKLSQLKSAGSQDELVRQSKLVDGKVEAALEKTDRIEKEAQDAKRMIQELESKLNAAEDEPKKIEFQSFNRDLTNRHCKLLEKSWLKELNVDLSRRAIGYMAQRIVQIETNSLGRLATSIEDAVLRTIVALSVPGKTLDVLEIGTLFGIGAAMIHDRTKAEFEKVSITLIDPLEGYYGNDAPDILTHERVTRQTLKSNLSRSYVPEEDYSIIQGFSTEEKVIKEASKQTYDVLIIDGDHSYTGVKFDFINYAPFVKQGGYVIIDDYHTDHWPEIAKFVDQELMIRDDIMLVGTQWRTAVFKVVKRIVS